MNIRPVAGFAAAGILVLLVALASMWAVKQNERAADLQKHTLQVLDTADDLLGMLKDAESGKRGYLATGDKAFLAPYLNARDSLAVKLANLRQLTADNPEQQHRLDILIPLIDERMALMEQAIDLLNKQDKASALEILRSGRGKRLTDTIRAEMRHFNDAETSLLTRHEAQFRNSQSQLSMLILLANTLFVLLILTASYLIYRESRRRITSQTEANRLLNQAHQSLREHTAMLAQFKYTLDHTRDGLFIFDSDTLRFSYVNQGAVQQVGYSEEELLKMTPLDIKPEFCEARFRELLLPLLNGKLDAYSFETVHRHKDGYDIPVEIVLQHVQCSEQRSCFIAFSRDITERKQSEARILASSAQLQATLDAIPDLMFEIGADGRYYDYHAHRSDLLATPADKLLGKTLAEVLPEQAVMTCMAAMKEAAELGRSTGKEITLPLPQGEHWFELSVAVKPDTTDPRFIFISRDITARKLTEAELRIAAVAFETQQCLIITNAAGVILRVNQAFTRDTGYSSEEAVGQTPRLLKSGRHDADFYTAMWGTLLRTGTWQGEIWDRRKSGEIYPKWLTINAVKDPNGSISHYVGVYIDLTERKSAEEEIRNLAFYDPLTRLPNRRLLMDRLHQALASSSRSGRHGALMFLDLDHFKNLNDTLGHDFGDLLLQQVALRLESCVREGDTVARLGGDEFVVMLENLSEQALEASSLTKSVGEKILTVLRQPYPLNSHVHYSTPSIGAVLFNSDRHTIAELLKKADIAMYQAKKAGRNTLRFFDPKMQHAIAARTALEDDLRAALASGQFHLYYQIQMDSAHNASGA